LSRSRVGGLVAAFAGDEYVVEVLDLIVNTPPPYNIYGISRSLGRSYTTVARCFRKLTRYENEFLLRYDHAPLGLSKVLVFCERQCYEKLKTPVRWWLRSLIDTVEGEIMVFWYPTPVGPDFIVKGIKEACSECGVRHTMLIKRTLYGCYSVREVVTPSSSDDELLKNAITYAEENPAPPNEVSGMSRDKPRDIFDLFLTYILEKHPLMSYRKLLESLLRKGFKRVRKRVNKHVKHLRDDGVIKGVSPPPPSPSRIPMSMLFMYFPNRASLRKCLSHILRFAFCSVTGVSDYEMVAVVRAELNMMPRIRTWLLSLGAEKIKSVTYDTDSVRLFYSVPFRAFDPLNREWCLMRDIRLNTLLREGGFY